MLRKIKNWIINYIGYKIFQRELEDLRCAVEAQQHKYEKLNDLLHMGIDVSANKHDPSWAVVCLNGKQPIVKFYDLRDIDAREINTFLRNFDVKNKVIDAPYTLRHFLNH